jgi:hypothetical protein
MQDLNGDGLGNPFATLIDCNQPAGYVLNPCVVNRYYLDADGDGLGDPNVFVNACDSVDGYVSNSDDLIDAAVSIKQRAVMVYRGATWCPPCGAYGDPTKEHIETTFGDDAVILNCQSGDAISPAGNFGPAFGDEYKNFYTPPESGIPHAFFTVANYAMTHSLFSSSNSQFDNTVNTMLAISPPLGVVAEATISGGVVTVQTATEFVSASGQHFIGIYLLEDGVMAMQDITGSSPANTAHNNVMRDAASTANPLGVQTIGTSFTAGQRVEGTFTITVPGTVVNSANLQVAVVVWNANTADGISNAVIVNVN